MRKIFTNLTAGLWPALFLLLFFYSCKSSDEKKHDGYDGPEERIRFEIERTRDISTGRVPWDQLLLAIQQTEQAKDILRANSNSIEALNWIERGPYTDVTGPSNGNTRANNGVTAGRVRGVMVDSLDPTHKTVWVGGVDGGLWKTTDITTAPANWILVNDFLSNLAIAAICQDPRPGFQTTMYFCTGESYGNADAVLGVGVFKSTDGGASWNFLPSTSTFTAGTRILCDYQGNVYLATRNNGLLRSTDGGTTWTNITPTGVSNNICDLEISSTSAPARLHMTTGIFSAQTYRYTDMPATVTSASGWNTPTTPFPSYNQRAEIAVSGNILYALPCNNSYQVPTIFKSTDGGDNWVATAGQPTGNWANGQGWYDLSVGINPSNPDECIVGGIDCHKTSNGGTSWTRISFWVGLTGQYVHADQHDIHWWDGGSKLLFACDGGVHYSGDGGTTIRDRNVGLRIKQFYSVAIHPTLTNYFLGGTQDNGVHQLTQPGLSSSVEVTGGDGAYVAIDQNEPQYQFGSYVYNVYRRSTNGGATWSTPINNTSSGRFINPWDLDNAANIIYACHSAGQYFRWNDPQTGTSTSIVPVAAFGGGNVSAVHASPFTANRVYFATGSGRVVRVDNANTTPVDVNITGATMPGGYINCVNTGSSDQFLIACYTNYNLNNVWVSNDGGTNWTTIDGNLPNMPVRWAMFHPDDDTKAFIATETGVWETELINGASTVWTPSTSFPTVRTDMIKYRPSDRTIAAGTHGRGIWSTTVPLPSGFTFNTPPPATSSCPAPASMTITLGTTATGGFSTPIILTASGNPAGTTVTFNPNPLAPGNSTDVTLVGTNTLNAGSYTITVTGTAGTLVQTRDLTYTITAGAGPAITVPPSNQTVCVGANTSFSITSAAATGFQWQVSTNGGANYNNVTNGGVYSGATTATLNITGVTLAMNGYLYRCIATIQCGSTTSSAATLTVNAAPAITGQPSNISICNGHSTTLTVTATGAGLTYQWQSAPACGGPWTNVGTNAPTLNVNPTTTTSYQVIVSGTCTPPVTSNCATVTVVDPPAITAQPADATACEPTPGTASFSVTASGAGINYQWQLSTNGGSSWNNVTNGGVYSGATTATLSLTGVTPAMNGYQYRVQLTNTTCTTPETSAAAILTVNTVPSITAHPQGATLCVGNNITFNVTATGTGLTYQWRKGGVNISGANSSSYTINGVTLADAGNYDVVVSGACPPAATSNAATLTVNTPITITTQPTAVNVCATGNTIFTVVATGTSPTYQWQVNTGSGFTNISNGGVYSGATTSTLTVTGITANMNSYQYRVVVTGASPCGAVNSNSAALNVTPQPVITAIPFTSLLPGRSTTLSVNITPGPNLTFAWYLNNVLIPGANGNSVVATVTDLGNYHVTITNSTSGVSCTSQIQNIRDSVSDKLFIFPSPNNGQFTVSYYNASGANTNRTVTVYDSHGAQVYNSKFGISGPYTLLNINLGAAQSGVYIVVVGDASGKKLIEGKVLVSH